MPLGGPIKIRRLGDQEIPQPFIMGMKNKNEDRSMASVSPVLLGVSLLPVSTDRWSKLVCLVASLVHASRLLSGGGESSKFSLLVLAGHDPVFFDKGYV